MVVGWILLFGGLLTIAGAWAGYSHRLPRNWLLGTRSGAAMRSDQAWHAAQAATALWNALQGLIFSGLGIWLLMAPDDVDRAWPWLFVTIISLQFVIWIKGRDAALDAERDS